MDRTKIARVDNVTLARRGLEQVGTLHLTPHHLIFSYIPKSSAEGSPINSQDSAVAKLQERWITYPMISFCTLKLTPSVSRQPSSIRLRCRDFTFYCFFLSDDSKARDVFESIKAWTCKLGRIEKLYAFTYQPQKPENEQNGWDIYDPQKEFERMGILEKGTDYGWRISKINTDYSFSPTYPSLLAVPSTISDTTINHAGRYRSRARIPVLTYLHPVNNCSITRSSQPLVGIAGNRSIQDEKLVASIFSTPQISHLITKTSSSPPSLNESQPQNEANHSDDSSIVIADGEEPNGNRWSEFLNSVPRRNIKSTSETNSVVDGEEVPTNTTEGPHVYGAQQENLIVDARPTVNAIAMQAAGRGSENMENYNFASKLYLGIDNIHVMRDSLNKVIDGLKDSDVTPLRPNMELLARSNWLKHISRILEGAEIIVRRVGIEHSHVLIHCSDGWDRTSQLSALSQLCLDPYYRTIEGFIVLVEKDWLSFGHMFRHRSGFLNSEKWFYIENERIGGDSSGSDPRRRGGNAFENALLSARGFFKQDDISRDSFDKSDDELQAWEAPSPRISGKSTPKHDTPNPGAKIVTKVKETSPVFHQFLDATYQLLYQYPTRFEFNERFLRRLLYHLYSCQYGTFLYDNEKERAEAHAREKTRSVWDYFLSRRRQFTNENYEPVVDDNKRGRERLIIPSINEVRWWNEVFGRGDEEMNG
ncbi:MAG: hypothetical protein M1834_000983 [Cirrosporium novae-zelandiae]|nr:MAG: hypothetical protein M1834_000983 [Cirrosporium novae-zelandiae]